MDELITVEELMVPLEEYATVSEDATLFEAIVALEKAQELQDRSRHHYLHRAVLVYGQNDKITGKISQLDVIRALEPKYQELGDSRSMARAGLSPEFIRSMLESFSLCDTSLTEMCSKGAKIIVKNFMNTPGRDEHVEAEASLCEAIHQFVIGQHQSLLVVREDEIVGILRLTDVFMTVFGIMKQCSIG
jgi:CBS domain-containing protein